MSFQEAYAVADAFTRVAQSHPENEDWEVVLGDIATRIGEIFEQFGSISKAGFLEYANMAGGLNL